MTVDEKSELAQLLDEKLKPLAERLANVKQTMATRDDLQEMAAGRNLEEVKQGVILNRKEIVANRKEVQALKGALEALRPRKPGPKQKDPTVPLKAEIQKLQAVIAELSAENLALKKGRWP